MTPQRKPGKYAAASVYFTQEEWTRLNIAVARSGKSRRRFMKDSVRAACGMSPSDSIPKLRKPERAKAASANSRPSGVNPRDEVSYREPTS